MKVSRVLKATIDTSVQVQRRLLMAAEPDDGLIWNGNQEDGFIRLATLASVAYHQHGPRVLLRQLVRLNTVLFRSRTHESTGGLNLNNTAGRYATEALGFNFRPQDANFATGACADANIYGTGHSLLYVPTMADDVNCLRVFITQPPSESYWAFYGQQRARIPALRLKCAV